jgi:Polyketide cyclase / dehydrase and lipid transport
VPVVRRSRTLAAPPDRVWEVVSDPYHMPRWWPDVTRMEAVEPERFTQVYTTRKGRAVRMDFRLLTSEPPGPGGDPPGRRVWEQELAGSPFERVLGEAITEIVLEPADGRTRVTIGLSQKLRGYSRTGGFMLRRATRGRLDQALRGLEQVVADS